MELLKESSKKCLFTDPPERTLAVISDKTFRCLSKRGSVKYQLLKKFLNLFSGGKKEFVGKISKELLEESLHGLKTGFLIKHHNGFKGTSEIDRLFFCLKSLSQNHSFSLKHSNWLKTVFPKLLKILFAWRV